MGLFGKKSEGGLMDVIRCDEQEYLVWKWRPSGEANSTKKENAIRFGSSLRVKDGELAVFVYKQKDGAMQDYIIGPYDQTIKTANFPILSGIVGSAFGGASPFQAEIYFINLAGNIPINFGIPYFNITDSRLADFPVPMSVRGKIIFNITDYKLFIKNTRLINFELDDFKRLIKSAVTSSVKSGVMNINRTNPLNLIQIEENLDFINETLKAKLKDAFSEDFGVNLKRFDIESLEMDQESDGYNKLLKVTRDQQEKKLVAEADVKVKDMEDMQSINAGNYDETLRIQREEVQRAQKLQTEGQNISVHQLNQQTKVAQTAAESMGKMGGGGSGKGGGGMMDPGSMMASMAMGGAVGQGMAGAVGGMMGGMNQEKQTPPPPPQVEYSVSVNGQQTGPFAWQQLQQMVQAGQITKDTHVWKQGMAGWLTAGEVQELANLFGAVPPPPPPPSPIS
ncbi:MAG: membrane protease subunit (stomatin/prohibitin family) [Flavobacteriales bacterium]|jgi:membrane protease subunit (stomatin/prohibitin family)|tara:strand:- start:8322 stop:9674 length:1353 start_codon:yes stop_codon:yes gene_type:complete